MAELTKPSPIYVLWMDTDYTCDAMIGIYTDLSTCVTNLLKRIQIDSLRMEKTHNYTDNGWKYANKDSEAYTRLTSVHSFNIDVRHPHDSSYTNSYYLHLVGKTLYRSKDIWWHDSHWIMMERIPGLLQSKVIEVVDFTNPALESFNIDLLQ